MDITTITARLANEYSVREGFVNQINDAFAIIKTQEKRIRGLRDAQEFNTVQINLLEVLLMRPDGVKIEGVERPPCGCPGCNPQKAQEPIPTATAPTPTKVAPAKKPAKRSKK